MTIASNQGELLRGMKTLDHLLALDARERLSRGDLAGAWDDILAQFRMSLQLGTSSPTLDADDDRHPAPIIGPSPRRSTGWATRNRPP